MVHIPGKMSIDRDGPYSYLPNFLKAFPHKSEIKLMFDRLGLLEAGYNELTGGIAAVREGVVPKK